MNRAQRILEEVQQAWENPFKQQYRYNQGTTTPLHTQLRQQILNKSMDVNAAIYGKLAGHEPLPKRLQTPPPVGPRRRAYY